ncbi:hypothetical protein BDB01DRAFT_795110 [Pilobolus umbonatus]|nr:hypothetical protein BDB01DRAFT_795110 [Pilobolus umbonatus]
MSLTPITEAEIKHLQGKYNTLTGGHGMTASTLKEIYRVAKISVTDREIDEQIRAADLKGSGHVDLEDFIAVMAKQHESNPEVGAAKIFALLDTDNDGQIGEEELKRGISLFGKSVSESDLREMVASADVDGDGLINYEEFLKVMTPCKVKGQTNF